MGYTVRDIIDKQREIELKRKDILLTSVGNNTKKNVTEFLRLCSFLC